MPRIRLSRVPGGRVRVEEGDGVVEEVDPADLLALLAAREAGSEAGEPLWVWDDTARWYPPLLAAGVRVRRCHDLRLARRILRRAPAVDPSALDGAEAPGWDRLRPVGDADGDLGLFAVDETLEHLDAAPEDDRQLAAVAGVARADPAEAARLRLLLAAESAGALVAAEMTYAGLPWRAEIHEQLLVDLLGPRPPRGARPARLEELVAQIRTAFDAPGLNPDSRPHLLAALRRAGLDVADTRAASLRGHDHPGLPALLAYKQLSRLATTNGWAWADAWVSGGRFRPSYLPGGSVTGRWSSNGGGALSFPVQIRPAAVADDGWRLVVADVAQLEPRVLAGMSGDRSLAAAARGADLYEAMVAGGAVATRQDAKLGLLGAMYGATSGGSGRLVAELSRRYPDAFSLLEQAARDGERGLAVRTLLGRGSPTLGEAWGGLGEATGEGAGEGAGEPSWAEPSTHDLDTRARQRRAYGRFTRNFVVQGTGAEWALCWIADLRNRLWALGVDRGGGDRTELVARPHLVFFLHDEVVVHTPTELADDVVAAVIGAAQAAGRLLFRGVEVDFPLTTAVVASYAEAKATPSAEADPDVPNNTKMIE